MIGTAQLVLFGLQAAVRLAQVARQAYAENTSTRGLVLPLPQGLDSPLSHAWQYAEHLFDSDRDRYDAEFAVADQGSRSSDASVRRLQGGILLDLFLVDLAAGKVPGFDVEVDQQVGLYLVRQWQEGDEIYPHPLQRVGGALVEIAVDYFVHVPGALDTKSKHGGTVLSFLEALDSTSFQSSELDELLVDIFQAAIQTASDHPEVFSDNAEHQKIVGSLVGGVAKESAAQLQKIREQSPEGDFDRESRLRAFGRAVLGSTLKNAGRELVVNPAAIGVKEPLQQALVEEVGGAFLNLVFEGPEGEYSFSGALRRTFSQEGFSQLALSSLKAVTQHPEVFEGLGEAPVRNWVASVLGDLYQRHEDDDNLFDDDLFAEVAYLVVDHGLRDLPLLLDGDDETRAFGVAVARSVFDAIASSEGGGVTWSFDLSREDVREIFEQVLGTVARNPQWLSRDPERQSHLALLLEVSVEVVGAADEGLLAGLVRSQRLEGILRSVLASGLEGVESETAEALGAFLSAVLASVREQGVSGLEAVLTDGSLTDLLKVVGAEEVLARIVSEDSTDVAELVQIVADLLGRYRTGERPSLTEMAELFLETA